MKSWTEIRFLKNNHEIESDVDNEIVLMLEDISGEFPEQLMSAEGAYVYLFNADSNELEKEASKQVYAMLFES